MTPALARRLAPSHALWLGPGGLWDHGAMPGWRPWASNTSGPAAPRHHAGFDAWCRAMPGHGCTLILSGWLLHELLLDPSLPLADDTARLGYARRLLQHYHGDDAAHWPLAAWQAGGQRGVSALHALTLQALQAGARQAGVALRGVRPWWSLALVLAQQQQPALAAAERARLLVVDGRLVTCVDMARGRLVGLQQRHLDSADSAGLRRLQAGLPPVERCAAIGHGLDAPGPADAADGTEAIQWLGHLHGAAPAALWHGTATPAPVAAPAPAPATADSISGVLAA
jgi:hypothetical protein